MTPYRFSYIEGEHALEEYAALLRLAFPGEGVDVLGKRLYDAHPGMSPATSSPSGTEIGW